MRNEFFHKKIVFLMVEKKIYIKLFCICIDKKLLYCEKYMNYCNISKLV